MLSLHFISLPNFHMRRLSVLLAVMVLAASLSGCTFWDNLLNKAPVATNNTPPPTITVTATPGSTKTISDALTAAGLTFTTTDAASAIKEMKTGAAIGKLTKFSLTGTKDTVEVTVGEISDTAQTAAVKAEIESQMVVLKQFSPNTVVDFVDVKNPSLLITVTYDKADVALGTKVETAIKK